MNESQHISGIVNFLNAYTKLSIVFMKKAHEMFRFLFMGFGNRFSLNMLFHFCSAGRFNTSFFYINLQKSLCQSLSIENK